jgi:hypothetical protein
MTRDALILLVVALAGFRAWRWLTRGARPWAGLVLAAAIAVPVLVGLPQPSSPLRWALTGVFAMLTWRAITSDWDLERPVDRQRRTRGLVLLSLGGVICAVAFLPVAVVALVRTQPIAQHHTSMPIRLLDGAVALQLAAGLLALSGHTPAGADVDVATLALVLGIALSHYLAAGIDKLRLGPTPLSWCRSNRLSFLVANSYQSGWWWWLSPEQAARRVAHIARLDRPLTYATIVVELGVIPAALWRSSAVGWLFVLVLFHLLIFSLSGICFWEYAMVDLLLVVAIVSMPASVWPGASVVAVAAIGATRLWWFPSRLGWWDSAVCGRIVWTVEGVDGRHYRLTNDFMDPHERLYGRDPGACYLRDGMPSGTCGTVLSDAARCDLAAYARSEGRDRKRRDQAAIASFDAEAIAAHRRRIRAIMNAVAVGKPRGPLHGHWRVLKAPGGHWYDRFHRERYDGSVAPAAVVADYREIVWLDHRRAFLKVDERRLDRFTIRS